MKLILRTNLNGPVDYSRWMLAPSSIAGKLRCLTRDGAQVVSVLPTGTVMLNPNTPEHDGPYEALVQDGNLIAYDYEGLTAAVAFGIITMSVTA